MPLNKYETVFIAEPDIPTDQVDELLSKIKVTVTAHQGSILSEDRWGRRRLAYTIRGHREGFYTLVNFAAEPSVITALDHLYNVTGPIIRYLTIRQVEPSKKIEPRRERPAKPPTAHRGPARAGGSPRSHYEHSPHAAASPSPTAAPKRAPETTPPASEAETTPREGEPSR